MRSSEGSIPDDAVTPGEAARAVKVHVSSIHRWISKGKVRSWSVRGTRYLVSLAEVKALCAPVPVQPSAVTASDRPRTQEECLVAAEVAKARLRREGWRGV